jgi:hypothetical protein
LRDYRTQPELGLREAKSGWGDAGGDLPLEQIERRFPKVKNWSPLTGFS